MKSPEQELQALIDRHVAEGRERGIQLAVYFRGDLAVNICSGTMSPDGPPVTPRTLFPVFSVSKGMTSTVIHRLVERGLFSWESHIADAWPEFGVLGKDRITLRHAMDHTSGIPYMPEGIGIPDLGNWETMCAAIAAMPLVSEPGEKFEYHAVTFGWILGEFARRVDGRTFPELLRDEVITPLGTDSLFIGLPEEEDNRVAVLEDPANDIAPPGHDMPKSVPPWLCPLHTLLNRAAARRACVPATSGVMNAESMARHYATFIPGGLNGVELLFPETVAEITGEKRPVDGDSRRLGYQVLPASFGGVTVGHNGYGGSTTWVDIENRLAVALTRNSFTDPESHLQIIGAVRDLFCKS